MTQVCKACGREKLLTDFYRNSIKKNGRDSKCKECRKRRNEAYRESRRDELRVSSKAYYRENREEILRKKKDHYDSNRTDILQKKKGYRSRPEVRERQRRYLARYVKDNAERLRVQRAARRNAIKSSILDLLGRACSLCGEPDSRLLTLDHVRCNGAEERRDYGGSLGVKRAILDGRLDKSDYRILCHSCNVGRYQVSPVNHRIAPSMSGRMKACPTCLLEKDESCFHSRNEGVCYECGLCRSFRRWVLKSNCFSRFGASCASCGEDSLFKLTMDHVRDDGSRRRDSERTGTNLYAKILNGSLPESDFQVLCFNCNYAKHVSSRDDPVHFDVRSLTVARLIGSDPREFLRDFHYAGYGRNGRLHYGGMLDGDLLAVAKFAPPVRLEVATSLGLEPGDVLELDRMCVRPGYNRKNLISRFLSLVIKEMRSAGLRRTLVSFSDPRFGHDGTAYRASNWELVGRTSPGYVYLGPDGDEVHKKTLYDRAKRQGLREREYANAIGYVRVRTPPKIKFVYRL